MLMHDLKKAVTTVIMARKNTKGENLAGPASVKPEMLKNEDGEADGRQAAAEDILLAIGDKSAIKLAQALSNFFDICGASSPEESEE